MTYIATFVASVPTESKTIYTEHLSESAELFKRHGATRIVECWGDDIPEGKLTSFPLAVKCEPNETVVFGFVEWPSKAAHDENMPKVMTEMEESMMSGKMKEPPLDGKRMIFGSFEVLLDT
ncbi:MAG: DUF1428 domain-containing protein [Rhodomicrobiaceae bacterium]